MGRPFGEAEPKDLSKWAIHHHKNMILSLHFFFTLLFSFLELIQKSQKCTWHEQSHLMNHV